MTGTLFSMYREDVSVVPTFSFHHFGILENMTESRKLRDLIKVPEVGIVVQGPIRHEYSFTLQTIKTYLLNFPDSQIILSTWNDEDINSFIPLTSENPNLHIITQEKPNNPGISNINLQICSTTVGLQKLKTMGIAYAIKTRTDQCMFDPLALIKLKDIYTQYAKNSKIITLSLGSFLFRPYGVSDFFQFGLTESLDKFWNVAHDHRLSYLSYNFSDKSSLRDFAKSEMCEVYLATRYLREHGEILDFSLRNSLMMYKKYFIVIDPYTIDLVWDKYTSQAGRWNQTSFPKPYQEISAGLWLILDSGIPGLAELDYLLDIPVLGGDFVRVSI